LNLAYVVAQIVFGILAHSLALLADAGHDFGDVLGLLLAWGATYLAKTRPTARRTYGLGRSSILAALANAILLMVAVGGISWEAIRRFANPAEVAGKTIMVVAAVGIVLNGVTATLFFTGRNSYSSSVITATQSTVEWARLPAPRSRVTNEIVYCRSLPALTRQHSDRSALFADLQLRRVCR